VTVNVDFFVVTYVLKLWEAVIRDDRLVYLVNELSRQQSTNSTAWVLLDAFSHLYQENWKAKRISGKNMKYLFLGKKKG
jgi:hypothetical protein